MGPHAAAGQMTLSERADELEEQMMEQLNERVATKSVLFKMADGKVEAWVRDDGPGIPPDAQERVFERFYRVDKARSREQGGTGLGLSIVKHIIQAHGGEVRVDSEPGKGTTFYFTLPADA